MENERTLHSNFTISDCTQTHHTPFRMRASEKAEVQTGPSARADAIWAFIMCLIASNVTSVAINTHWPTHTTQMWRFSTHSCSKNRVYRPGRSDMSDHSFKTAPCDQSVTWRLWGGTTHWCLTLWRQQPIKTDLKHNQHNINHPIITVKPQSVS